MLALPSALWAALLVVRAGGEPSYAIDQAPPEGLWLSAQAGGGVIDGDVVAGVGVGVGFETRPFAVHLRAPVTLRVVDLEPLTSAALPSSCRVVRCEEWTEAGELSPRALARVVDELRVLQPGDAFHLRAGPLFASLGHGQLVSRYTNAADWDRRTTGVYVESNLPWGRTQIQGLVGALLAPQEMFGVRIATSPLDDPSPEARSSTAARFLGRMRLGFEVAGDLTAPRGAVTDAFGDIRPGSPSRPVVGAATDLAWPLLDDSLGGTGLQIEPWVGASTMYGLTSTRLDGGDAVDPSLGFGATAGLDLSLDLIFVATRLGGRAFVDSLNHRSAVFNTTWDVDRKRSPLIIDRFSRAGIQDARAGGGVGGAGLVEVIVLRALRMGGRVHLDPVPDARQVEVFGELGAGPVHIAGRALRRAVRDLDDVVVLDDRTLVVTEAAWAIFAPFSLTARWLHTPRFEDSPPPGKRAGDPIADDDVFVGVSFDLVLSPGS